MGPNLAQLARRLGRELGRSVASSASRFGARERDLLTRTESKTIACDVLDRDEARATARVPELVYMVGQKFGTSGNQPLTWATNVYAAALAAERFAASRIVAFSTGNVYPLSSVGGRGPNEHDPVGPVGDYAESSLGRERMFEFFSQKNGTKAALLRLTHAELPRRAARSRRCDRRGEPIDLAMGHVNAGSGSDANSVALRAHRCASPPFIQRHRPPQSATATWPSGWARLGCDRGSRARSGDRSHDPSGVRTRSLRRREPGQADALRGTRGPVLMPPLPLPPAAVRAQLARGLVIPAHPLALTSARRLDERRQRALTRYYLAAGAGGVAVGVHTTQFAIRGPKIGLLRPVLELAAETVSEFEGRARRPVVRVAGICGRAAQAVREAELAVQLGYHAGLLSLAALPDASVPQLIAHARAVAAVIPLFGFYLQSAVGGRPLGAAFWRRFVRIENVVAIKIAPFDRYRTLDVLRAVAESGRAGEIALYTGNYDHIVLDLLTPRMVGGLLGHWAFWTRRAVDQLAACRRAARSGAAPRALLRLASEVTDANGAVFDAANGFAGCIPGIHEVLRRQGLLRGRWCLDPREELSPGQMGEIDRACRAYPHLNDDAFVAEHLDEWMA